MTIFEGKENLRELKFEAFLDEQTDFHPLIMNNPTLILPTYLKNTNFEVFHELELESGRIRIDFLYVFEDGSILIAEVKLSDNRQITRTVVAQIQTYASSLRQMTPKDLIKILKGQNPSMKNIIMDETFEKKLARGLHKKIVMEIVTDSYVNDLNKLLGFIAGRDDVSVCLAEIRKYVDSGRYFLEVNIRHPEYSSPTDIERTSIDEFADELAKKYKNEATEIRNVMENLPAGWEMQCGSGAIYIWKNNYILNFNHKKDKITLWGKPDEYSQIVETFKGEDIAGPESIPSSKKNSFIVVRFPCKGMTSKKIMDILNKLDKL